MHPYLKVCELWVIKVWVDVQCCAHHQQRFKLVQGRADVSSKAQTPYFQKSLKVKQHSKSNLEQSAHLLLFIYSWFKVFVICTVGNMLLCVIKFLLCAPQWIYKQRVKNIEFLLNVNFNLLLVQHILSQSLY